MCSIQTLFAVDLEMCIVMFCSCKQYNNRLYLYISMKNDLTFQVAEVLLLYLLKPVAVSADLNLCTQIYFIPWYGSPGLSSSFSGLPQMSSISMPGMCLGILFRNLDNKCLKNKHVKLILVSRPKCLLDQNSPPKHQTSFWNYIEVGWFRFYRCTWWLMVLSN